MSKWNFKYQKTRKFTPLSYWVHKGVNEQENGWTWCKDFTPSFPKRHPVKGYPYLTVTVHATVLEFASMKELDHFVDVLSRKNLPTTIFLSKQRGSSAGPNRHWLSRLPSKLKPWSKREKIISVLSKVRADMEKKGLEF